MTKLASLLRSHKDLVGQIARFGIAGVANVGVDAIVYLLMLHLVDVIWVAKAVAYVCGTIFAYTVNRIWTFRAGPGSARQFGWVAAVYASSLVVNVAVNSLALLLLGSPDASAKAIAYFCALVPSVVINFVGMKLVFSRSRKVLRP